MVESILKPSVKLAQAYETYKFEKEDGRSFQGFVIGERVVDTVIRQADSVKIELKNADVDTRTVQKLSAMPDGLAANLAPEQLADLIAYLQSLK